MSRSSFSKAYEEITNLKSMEMTFTIEDADLDKLNDALKDINVRECPWFEVQDKHGNKAKYYREPHWIPTSKERPPQYQEIWITDDLGTVELVYGKDGIWLLDESYYTEPEIIAWMPANVPSPYQEVEEEPSDQSSDKR